MDRYQAIARIIAALDHAENKFPWWPTNAAEASSILSEESGETVKALNEYHWTNGPIEEVLKEAAHTGAMAIRVLMGCDKYERAK